MRPLPLVAALCLAAIDSGDQDRGVAPTVTELHRVLEHYGIPHEYGIYPGNHINNVHARIPQHHAAVLREAPVVRELTND